MPHWNAPSKRGMLYAMSKRIILNSTLAAGSIFFLVIMLEIALRVVGISYPYFRMIDASTGFAPRPNARGWNRNEGEAYIEINADGFRDEVHTIEKPENTIRIAVLGDSFTEALQVDIDETFWKIAEKNMQTCVGTDVVEFLNFGVSGFGTAQELQMLRSRVWQYDPDIVVLNFHSGNDIRDNSKALSKSDDIPYFSLMSGSLVLDDSFRHTDFFTAQQSRMRKMMHAILNHSRVLQVLNHVRIIANQPSSERTATHAIDATIFTEPKNTEWENAWRVTEALVGEIGNDVREHGASFVVMIGTNGIQVHPDKEKREEFMQSAGIRSLSYADERLTAYAKSHGFPVLILAEPLLVIAEKNNVYLHGFANNIVDDGHWNEDGHAAVGQILSEFLCETVRENVRK